MNTHFRTALLAASLAAGLGYATVTFSKPQPPPPPPYNPQILYSVTSKGGSTSTFTVANADGADAASLYSTRNVTSGLKFAPTGNRIVFTEQNDIKVLTYAVSAQGVTTTSVTTLASEPYQPMQVDVSPDGTLLLVVEHTADPNQWAVYVMGMSGLPARTQIPLGPNIYPDAVWANSNSRIAVIQGAPVEAGFGVQTIQVIDLDTGYGIASNTAVFTSTLSQLYQLLRLESAHTSDTLLFAASPLPTGSNSNVYKVDIGTLAVTAVVAGRSASFSADDSTILFQGAAVGDLFTLNLNTNVQKQITSNVLLGRPDFLP
jgi:hypothetical protein